MLNFENADTSRNTETIRRVDKTHLNQYQGYPVSQRNRRLQGNKKKIT